MNFARAPLQLNSNDDPYQFFEQNSRIPLNAPLKGLGICPKCLRKCDIFAGISFNACATCLRILRGYGPSVLKFGIAVIHQGGSEFYSKDIGVNDPNFIQHENMKAVSLLNDIIRNPPQTKFMVIQFGAPTDTRNLRINRPERNCGVDLLLVSGNATIAKGTCPAGVINVKLIHSLLTNYPGVDWKKIHKIQADIRKPKTTEITNKISKSWREIDDQFPNIFLRAPHARTIEAKLLEDKNTW